MERLQKNDPGQIGPYQLISRLGSGGMGIVYLGSTGTRTAAVKIVRDFLLEDPTSRTRLAREVDALKRVQSPYVAGIVNSNVESTPAWIATHYVDGPNLKTLVTTEGVLGEVQWFEFAFGIISALDAVHKAGLIHRDIKPSNVLMSANGPRLIDFGISFSKDSTSITRTGMVAGTPTWFAPEQFQSNKITSAVDIFAAGSILYFAATGNSPWGDEDTSVAKTMNSILTTEPDLNKLTFAQRRLIEPMIVKNPKDRFSASKLIELMREIRESTGIQLAGTKNSKKKVSLKSKIAIASLVIILSGSLGVYVKQNLISSAAIPKKIVTSWDIKFEGDTNSQKGKGTEYSAFVCDQAVVSSSMVVRELTLPEGIKKPKAQVVPNDARCGEGFDAIVVTGSLNDNLKDHTYLLAGSTRTGFLLNYKFTVRRVEIEA